jgi:hypothetical protein
MQVWYVIKPTDICGHLNDLNSKLQGKCQLVSEMHNDISTIQIKLWSFHSQLLNNSTSKFPNCQETFHQYKTNGGRYVRHTEQLQQLFADKGLFRKFASLLEASYEDAEPALQLELIEPRCSDELRSKFKEGATR